MFSPKIKKSIKEKSLSVEIEIKIPSEILIEIRNTELENAKDQLSVPGFRKGHATLESLIENYGSKALEIAVNNKVREIVNEVITENKYSILTTPTISFKEELNAQKDLIVSSSFLLKPQFEINYNKVSIDVENVKLTENEKEEELNKLKEKMGSFELSSEENRQVQNGDSVNISFLGKIDDVPFEGGFANSYDLVIGSKTFIDTFEEQLIGKKVGEKIDVNVKFPDNYHSKNLEGKNAVFEVVIKTISKKIPATLDDEFAKKFKLENIEEFKKSFIENIERYCNNSIKEKIKPSVFEKLTESLSFDIPEKLFENELNYRFEKQKEKNKEIDIKSFKKENEKSIRNSLRIFFLVEEIILKENISISDDDIKEFIIQTSYQSNLDPKKEVEKIMKNEAQKNNIYTYLKELRCFDIIFDKINKNIKIISKKEFDLKNDIKG